VIVYSPRFLDHAPSPLHVERPDRLRAVVARLRAEGLFEDVVAPVPAPLADVRRVHGAPYLDAFATRPDGFLDPETALDDDTFEIARLAAGAVLDATRASVDSARPTVALVRPPGHHAGPGYGGGFCYLNSVAIAAAAHAASGRRIAILDYDAHHGNGTQDIFAADPRVLYVSTHQFGIYPGTGPAEDVGEGEGRGFTVNVPFRAGCGDASYRVAFDDVIEPIVRAFRPDAVLVSLGVDAHYRDPLTSLALSSPGYVELVNRSADLAARTCGSRFVLAMEGGYHLDALAEVWAGVVGHLAGRRAEAHLTADLDAEMRGAPAVRATRAAQSEFWNLR
jgi:acetoin utilization deacetylase AcuC-like enzyme